MSEYELARQYETVNLLRAGVGATGGVWADFGAGAGAFTLALADLLGPGAEIIAIDRDPARLRANERAILEEVTLAHLVTGALPESVRRLADLPGSWEARTVR